MTTGALVATTLLMTTGGCSSGANVEWGEVIAVVAPQSTGLQELAEGELVVAPGGCIALETDDQLMLLAWPPGVQLDSADGRTTVTVPRTGESFTIGDRVAIGGGLQANESAEALSIPIECGEFAVVYLVNGLG